MPGEDICRLYDGRCFHEERLEKKLIRETYCDLWEEDDQTMVTTASTTPSAQRDQEFAGTGSGEGESPEKIQLSSLDREYAAYPIQTRLKDGRPSVIIDPGSVGNLCGDKWAKEVALMAKASGHKPAYQLRDRALQVSGVGLSLIHI